MLKLVFATNNAHKLSEAQAILGTKVEIVTLAECGITEDIPEDQPTIEGNALQKAHYVYGKSATNCFADDTGLEVEALNGAPGVHSARYATDGHDFEANIDLLLKNLQGATNRKARFKTVVALIIDGKEYTFEGIINGKIIESRAGVGGFGYDSVFVPDGYEQTFAEMSPELKNIISHRALAMEKLNDFVSKL